MFDFVRTHSKLMLGLLVLLVIPSFVLFGVDGYQRMNEGEAQVVARVDGRAITQGEWDAAHRRQVELMRRQMPTADVATFDTPQARYQTLEDLVRERVLAAAQAKLHISVSDEQLQRELLSVPALASLRRPDGSIDSAAYRSLLSAQGMTPESFEASVRQESAMRRVLSGVVDTPLPAGAVGNTAIDALLQQREIQLLRFPASANLAKVQPTDADLEAYYQKQGDLFRTQETAEIQYVVLDTRALEADITVGAEDLRKYYDENIARYTSAEERRASHILIKTDKSAAADVKAKAKAEAEALLAEVRKAPQKFAEFARTRSQDPGSARQGGDLDFFGRGAMVKPFEDAAFAMKVGEISNLVESDFGFHIIRLDAVRGGERRSFESAKAEIEAQVRQQLAQRRYAEVAEQFSNTVYEQSDSLQPVVDKFKLKLQTAMLSRQPAPSQSGPLASPKLIEAVFGDEVLRNKRNTDAIETGSGQLTAARVLRHQPSIVPPLEAVRPIVLDRLKAQQAADRARADGTARLAELQKAASDKEFSAPAVISRLQTRNLPPELLEAALKASDANLPAFVGVELGLAGYAIARINKVLPPEVAEADRAQLASAYARAWSQTEAGLYYEALKRRFKVSIQAPKPAPTAGV